MPHLAPVLRHKTGQEVREDEPALADCPTVVV